MESEALQIPIEHKELESVSGLLELPDAAPRSHILLAHGAGLEMENPWMTSVARGLVARGNAVLRFNYPYKERTRRDGKNRPPDRAPVLEAVHERALEALRERAHGGRVLLAGKSMGGRMSTHLAAKDSPCAGLILFGYPLHPPGKKERLRREHFPAIVQPALFLQGTRDNLCDLELLRESLRTYGGSATVEVIEGADHGFHVRKSSGRTDGEVLEGMLDRVRRWEAEAFPE